MSATGELSERSRAKSSFALSIQYSYSAEYRKGKEIIRRASWMNAAGPHTQIHGITDLYKRCTQTTRDSETAREKAFKRYLFIYYFFSLFTRVLVLFFQNACGGAKIFCTTHAREDREGDDRNLPDWKGPVSSSSMSPISTLALRLLQQPADLYNRRKQKPKKNKNTWNASVGCRLFLHSLSEHAS
jgi:hypothetical protein